MAEPAKNDAVPASDQPVAGFVAVGHNGQLISSLDGRTWDHVQTGKEGEVFRAVAFGSGTYVAVGNYGGNNIMAASRDGHAWTVAPKNARYVTFMRGILFGDGKFLAIGGDPGAVGDSKPFVLTSPDGVAWSDYVQIAGKNILRRVAFGNGRYVGVGDRGRRATSKDGLAWDDVKEVRAPRHAGRRGVRQQPLRRRRPAWAADDNHRRARLERSGAAATKVST